MNLSLTQFLPDAVKAQFEDLISGISSGWGIEHNPDGTHKQVTASGNIVSTDGFSAFGGQLRAKFGLSGSGASGTGQTISNATLTDVIWKHPIVGQGFFQYDNGNIKSNNTFLQPDQSGNLTLIVPPEPGLYLVIVQAAWEQLQSGRRIIYLQTSPLDVGADSLANSKVEVENAAGKGLVTHQCMVVFPVEPGNQGYARLKMQVYQSCGSSLTLVRGAGDWATFLQITKIG